MNIKGRLERAEAAYRPDERRAARRRLMELIALGTMRLRGARAPEVAGRTEAELLSIIGTDAGGFDDAVNGFVSWWRGGGRAEMIACGYEVRHFNL